jgi:hypothetical protein
MGARQALVGAILRPTGFNDDSGPCSAIASADVLNKRRVTRNAFCPIFGSGGEALPVGRLAFKAREGRLPVLSGFDSHSLPPI